MGQMADEKQLIEKHGKVYEPGTILFREGEVGKRIYVINEGRIRLSKRIHHTECLVEVLGPGEFCGELALVTEAPHPVTATVLETARLLIVDARNFETMVRSNSEIALRMLRKMAGRLTQAQFRVVNFSLRRPMARLLHQLKWEANLGDREKGVPLLPDDLAEVLGLEKGDVKQLISVAVKEGLIEVSDEGRFFIINTGIFDRYLSYLELKDRFEYLE
jgi:CRP/FNR family cyclic AMP-dependent transcriptional regulator